MEWSLQFDSLYKGCDGQYNLKTIYMLNSTADVIK
nr:MAG TPA: hypothetical protein [Caudoviricetes sp.]